MLTCHIIILASLPASLFNSFWPLQSAAFSDFKNVVIMRKLLQLLVTTLICSGSWDEQGTPTYPVIIMLKAYRNRLWVGGGHRQLCRPCCLGFMHCYLGEHMVRVGKEKDGVFMSAFLTVTGAEQGSAWSAGTHIQAHMCNCKIYHNTSYQLHSSNKKRR